MTFGIIKKKKKTLSLVLKHYSHDMYNFEPPET